MKSKKLLAMAASVAFTLPVLAQSNLTVVTFGGANAVAIQRAYVEPFERANNTRITMVEYAGEMARIKAMVEARRVTWDVVAVESPDLHRGCDEGLFEKLDWSKIGNKADLMPEAVHDCGVGAYVWSTVLAFNADRLQTAPTSWADFWDVQQFPGRRGMRKGARFNLEFALMADGVKPADVYRVLATREGADRAFRKLSELKPHIQWWTAGAQPPQFLVAGDVVMTTAFNGRIYAAQREGRNLKINWVGGIYDLDFWTIPRGSRNKEAAHRFIAFASTPEAQANYVRLIPYGPTNVHVPRLLDDRVLAELPTAPANAREALRFSYDFWADQGEALERRFAVWAAQ